MKYMTNLPAKKTNISIIEDNEIYREWLKLALTESKNFDLISVDGTGRDGMESVRNLKPKLVLLDFQLTDMTGLEVSKRIKAYDESTKIFMLTAHTDVSILERIIHDRNIDAVAIKDSHYFEMNFIEAINYTLDGGTYLEPSILNKLRQTNKHAGLSNLTKREFELFIQLNVGKSDQKIAEDLCVEVSHVKNLKSKIIKKVKDDDLDGLLAKLLENAAFNKIL